MSPTGPIVSILPSLPGLSAHRWLPAVAGYAVEVVLLVLAAAVSLPPVLARVAGIATLGVGLAGGIVAGRLSADPRAARRNGVLVGVAGGITAGALVRGTMSLAIPRARWSAVWAIEYAVATGVGRVLRPDVAARYDGTIATAIAAAVGCLAIAGSVVGAAASSPLGVDPE